MSLENHSDNDLKQIVRINRENQGSDAIDKPAAEIMSQSLTQQDWRELAKLFPKNTDHPDGFSITDNGPGAGLAGSESFTIHNDATKAAKLAGESPISATLQDVATLRTAAATSIGAITGGVFGGWFGAGLRENATWNALHTAESAEALQAVDSYYTAVSAGIGAATLATVGAVITLGVDFAIHVGQEGAARNMLADGPDITVNVVPDAVPTHVDPVLHSQARRQPR